MGMRAGYWTCLAGGGEMAIAGTASGQRGGESAEQKVLASQEYVSPVCSEAAFRAKRVQQECGPITDPELHQSCLATFDCGGGAPRARNWRKAPPSETIR